MQSFPTPWKHHSLFKSTKLSNNHHFYLFASFTTCKSAFAEQKTTFSNLSHSHTKIGTMERVKTSARALRPHTSYFSFYSPRCHINWEFPPSNKKGQLNKTTPTSLLLFHTAFISKPPYLPPPPPLFSQRNKLQLVQTGFSVGGRRPLLNAFRLPSERQ